jgi:hypothetical protein
MIFLLLERNVVLPLGLQLLERDSEPEPRSMESPSCGHGQTADDLPDLGWREALPLSEEQNFAIHRPQATKCLANSSVA